MISTKQIVKTANVMWIKRFCNYIKAKFKVLAIHMMGIDKNILIKKQLLQDNGNKGSSKFYNDLLTTWFNVINNNVRLILDLLDENIFDNPLFLIYNKMLCAKGINWNDVGIIKVSDIWSYNRRTFLSKAELEITHGITISDLMYNEIVSILSYQVKKILKVKNYNSILKYINLPKKCINEKE